MSLAQGLVKGRSHIVFMVGLVAAFGIILTIERSALLDTGGGAAMPSPAAVTEAATVAWHAAARSPGNGAVRFEARQLGVDIDAKPDTAPPAMSPAAGVAILDALAARQRAAPVRQR